MSSFSAQCCSVHTEPFGQLQSSAEQDKRETHKKEEKVFVQSQQIFASQSLFSLFARRRLGRWEMDDEFNGHFKDS